MELLKSIIPGISARWRPDEKSPKLEEAVSREDEETRQDWLQAMPLLLLARTMQAESSACSLSSRISPDEPDIDRTSMRRAPAADMFKPGMRSDAGRAARPAYPPMRVADALQPGRPQELDARLVPEPAPRPASPAERAMDSVRSEVHVPARPLSNDGNGTICLTAATVGPVGGRNGAHEPAAPGTGVSRTSSKASREGGRPEDELRRHREENYLHPGQQAWAAARDRAAAAASAAGWRYLFRSWKGQHSVTVTAREQERDPVFFLRPGSDVTEQRLRQHGAGHDGHYRLVGSRDAGEEGPPEEHGAAA